MFVGFGFKISAAPFQIWAPDVYQGAPAPVSAFLSVGPKAAAFAILLRIFLTAFGPIADALGAVRVGLRAGDHDRRQLRGDSANQYQANAGLQLHRARRLRAGGGDRAFRRSAPPPRCSIWRPTRSPTSARSRWWRTFRARAKNTSAIDDFAGLAQRQPAMAAMLTIFLLSLIGVPLTGGFFGKFYIFKAALDAHLVWLTVLGLLNSAVAAYYYLRVLVVMYFKEPGRVGRESPGSGGRAAHRRLRFGVGNAAAGHLPGLGARFRQQSRPAIAVHARRGQEVLSAGRRTSRPPETARPPASAILMFQHPGVRMRHQHRSQPRFERRIDVRLRRIPDHPRPAPAPASAPRRSRYASRVLFLHDRRVREIAAQAGAVDLQLLLLGMAFGEQASDRAVRPDTPASPPRLRSVPCGCSRIRSASDITCARSLRRRFRAPPDAGRPAADCARSSWSRSRESRAFTSSISFSTSRICAGVSVE